MTMDFTTDPSCARELDASDPLALLREEFHVPRTASGNDEIYFCGNSLGLCPRRAQVYVDQEFEKWQNMGVKGHVLSDHPWMPYHEFVTNGLARLVGARPEEVVAMNSLTVNLHLMMVSFYRPTAGRHKILMEAGAFPSDRHAVWSQIRHHGLDPEASLVEVAPRDGADHLEPDQVLAAIAEHGDGLALVMLPGVQYYTGQVFDMASITRAAHDVGALVGFDLAHAAGNVVLSLHDWDVDFAVWCHYKYLNSGPGAVAGCFVHERHAVDTERVRFAGWWGHDKASRFAMGPQFLAIPTAEGWQLSNPPILALAPLRASLEVFDRAGGMEALRTKSETMIGYLDYLLEEWLRHRVEILTPKDLSQRGCQFSIRIPTPVREGKEVFSQLEAAGVTCDWREPGVIRIAPVPLYNTFDEVHRFARALNALLPHA